jgi:hypothetical protein
VKSNTKSLIGGAAVVLTAIGITAGMPPASAAPMPTPGATLSVVTDIVDPAYNRLIFSGVFPMEEPDAVGYLTHLGESSFGGMVYSVYADDGSYKYLDDRHFPGTSKASEGDLWASRRGLEYRRELVYPKGFLNKNLDGIDRVYVRAIFTDADGGQRIQFTNVAEGNF